jgi:transcriptional regulator of nitric oxide reductase
MKRRDAIFDRLALKEKLFINQQMRSLGALDSELQKLKDMRQKLSDMAADSAPKIREQTAFTLRSSSELNYQIRDQLETASNRSDHLSQELKSMRQKIALSDRRREKSASKAEQIRRTERNEREARRDDDDASRRKPCPR